MRPVRIGDWPVMKAARPACTSLAVPVGEDRALPADAVDVGRAVAHDLHVVGADVKPADIVAHDEQDVGFSTRWRRLRLRYSNRRARAERGRCRQRGAAEQNVAAVEGCASLGFVSGFHTSLPCKG